MMEPQGKFDKGPGGAGGSSVSDVRDTTGVTFETLSDLLYDGGVAATSPKGPRQKPVTKAAGSQRPRCIPDRCPVGCQDGSDKRPFDACQPSALQNGPGGALAAGQRPLHGPDPLGVRRLPGEDLLR